jgi:hypothetical protein
LKNNQVRIQRPNQLYSPVPGKGIVVIGDIVNLYCTAAEQVFFAFAVDEITGDDCRVLLRPGNNMDLYISSPVESPGKRSVIIGNTSLEFWSGTKSDNCKYLS